MVDMVDILWNGSEAQPLSCIGDLRTYSQLCPSCTCGVVDTSEHLLGAMH